MTAWNLIQLDWQPAPEQHALYQEDDPDAPYYDPTPGGTDATEEA